MPLDRATLSLIRLCAWTLPPASESVGPYLPLAVSAHGNGPLKAVSASPSRLRWPDKRNGIEFPAVAFTFAPDFRRMAWIGKSILQKIAVRDGGRHSDGRPASYRRDGDDWPFLFQLCQTLLQTLEFSLQGVHLFCQLRDLCLGIRLVQSHFLSTANTVATSNSSAAPHAMNGILFHKLPFRGFISCLPPLSLFPPRCNGFPARTWRGPSPARHGIAPEPPRAYRT